MKIPTLHEIDDEFDERNLLLQMTLGLVSVGDRLAELLAEEAAPDTGPQDTSSVPDEDPLADAVLGLLSFRSTLQRQLASAAVDLARQPATIASPDLEIRELLR